MAGLINTLEGLGMVYTKVNQPDKARDIFRSAIDLLTNHADVYTTEKYHDVLVNHVVSLETNKV